MEKFFLGMHNSAFWSETGHSHILGSWKEWELELIFSYWKFILQRCILNIFIIAAPKRLHYTTIVKLVLVCVFGLILFVPVSMYLVFFQIRRTEASQQPTQGEGETWTGKPRTCSLIQGDELGSVTTPCLWWAVSAAGLSAGSLSTACTGREHSCSFFSSIR